MFYYGQKRESHENYFPVHNRIFDLGLCAEELAIYLYLVRCEDKKTFTCYPSHATIGSCIGRTANTVQKYVKELEKKRLITTEMTMVKAKNGRYCNGSLRYTIRPIQDAIDYFDEQQMRKLQAEMARRNAEEALKKYDEKRRYSHSKPIENEAG